MQKEVSVTILPWAYTKKTRMVEQESNLAPSIREKKSVFVPVSSV